MMLLKNDHFNSSLILTFFPNSDCGIKNCEHVSSSVTYKYKRKQQIMPIHIHFTYIDMRTHVCGFLTTFGKIHAYLL
jgi:hypothetical protein